MSIASLVIQNICKQGTECVLHEAHERHGLCPVGAGGGGGVAPWLTRRGDLSLPP